jgi:hypothetical protein
MGLLPCRQLNSKSNSKSQSFIELFLMYSYWAYEKYSIDSTN